MHYPVSILATLTAHAERRLRIEQSARGRRELWFVMLEAKRGDTIYRAELPMGEGASAAIAAGSRASRLRRGAEIVIHADRERIVTGRHQRIELLDVRAVEPLGTNASSTPWVARAPAAPCTP